MILQVGGEARRGREAEGMDLEGEVVCGKPAQKMSARRLPLSWTLSLPRPWWDEESLDGPGGETLR